MPPPTSTCPSCDAPATGRFCANCGATLAGGTCAACGGELTPGAKFCHHCGATVSAGTAPAGNSGRLPWIVAAVALLTVLAMIAGRSFASRGASTPAATAAAAPAGADQPADNSAQPRGPDISSLTPEEQADRLFNRVMRLAGEGKQDSVQFFAPMAISVYQSLSPLNTDQRYDVGRIGAVAGAIPFAKAQADTILKLNPTHLLGLILAAEVAKAEGRASTVRDYQKKLLAAQKSELARKLPEYDRHTNDITAALAAARRDTGAA
jgi:hypothetical protein